MLLTQVPPGGMWEVLRLTQQAETARQGPRGYVEAPAHLSGALTAGWAERFWSALWSHLARIRLSGRGDTVLLIKEAVTMSPLVCPCRAGLYTEPLSLPQPQPGRFFSPFLFFMF